MNHEGYDLLLIKHTGKWFLKAWTRHKENGLPDELTAKESDNTLLLVGVPSGKRINTILSMASNLPVVPARALWSAFERA